MLRDPYCHKEIESHGELPCPTGGTSNNNLSGDLPKYDVAAWQEGYGEHVTFQLVLSLNGILLIGRFNVVLIPGK